ncbi:copper chaperone PCu(A)C [Streptomyces aureocirculatus]|uniref:copper chaperone PCu(A)C n=1 Tax=Streptomyces aureocirculatus TaxID=67275 RepID=UPI0006914142|nr:copper chaperone PCu(A)C [Streptomyces aureocirculatus]
MNHRTTRRRRLLGGGALALTAVLVLAGCGDDSGSSDSGSASASSNAAKKPELAVSGAYIPAPAMDDMAGGFFKITNKGAADKLVSASSPLAGSVTLHATVGSTMKERKSFDVPANGELDFARGGNHIMLERLKHKPKQGDKVEVTLRFEKSKPITVTMAVRAATYNPDAGAEHDSGATAKHPSGAAEKHDSGNTKTHSTTDKHAAADEPTDMHASH